MRAHKTKEGHSLNILFWDIDGTLLRTNKAGLYAFQQAAADLLGSQADLKSLKTAGMTDYYIASQIIQAATGQNPVHRDIIQLIQHYEELLPTQLEIHQGHLLPSVLELLTALHNHPAFICMLLTGNTATGAKTKLSFFHIAHFFDFTLGAFGLHCLTRNEVAIQAKQLVLDSYPYIPFEHVFVIGDTPYDIDCGKFIGAQTIAVATGMYTYADLAAHSPWWLVKRLPSPDDFIRKFL